MTHHPCGHHPVRARAIVHHDDAGRIVSIILPDPSPNAPPAGVFVPPNLHVSEVELPDELRGLDLATLHRDFRIDRSQRIPRLAPRDDRPKPCP